MNINPYDDHPEHEKHKIKKDLTKSNLYEIIDEIIETEDGEPTWAYSKWDILEILNSIKTRIEHEFRTART